jgi:osmotically-inducible protein OsmY
MWSVRTLRQFELLVALFLVLLLFACSAASPQRSETDRTVDDATIQATVKSELVDDPRIDAEAVKLDVRRGVVMLVGDVGSDNERKAIEDVVWRVSGVKDVDNRLQLRQERVRKQ